MRRNVMVSSFAACGGASSSTRLVHLSGLRFPSRRALRTPFRRGSEDLTVSSICPKSGALMMAGRMKLPSSFQVPPIAATGVTSGANGKMTSRPSICSKPAPLPPNCMLSVPLNARMRHAISASGEIAIQYDRSPAASVSTSVGRSMPLRH